MDAKRFSNEGYYHTLSSDDQKQGAVINTTELKYERIISPDTKHATAQGCDQLKNRTKKGALLKIDYSRYFKNEQSLLALLKTLNALFGK